MHIRQLNHAWSSSVVRYLTAGVLSFAFDAGLLWLLHEVFAIPVAVATPVAFLASFAVTYSLQRTVAFRSDDAVAPSVLRYTALVVINTIATTVIVWAVDSIGLPWLTGKVLAVAVTTIGNYFAYRYWVFGQPGKTLTDV